MKPYDWEETPESRVASRAPQPPNYRAAIGSEHCGNCKMFHQGNCWGYGNRRVARDKVCDSWATDKKISATLRHPDTPCPRCGPGQMHYDDLQQEFICRGCGKTYPVGADAGFGQMADISDWREVPGSPPPFDLGQPHFGVGKPLNTSFENSRSKGTPSVKQSSKIDYLAKQPGFAQTPEGQAGIHMLRTRYPETGDPMFPLLFREYKRGNIVLSPYYMEHWNLAHHPGLPENERAMYKEQLDGDRPDGYFWKPQKDENGEPILDPQGRPRMDPIQQGMVQNVARMFKWMKGANQPLPNMDAKNVTLEQIQKMYNDWKAKYDTKRDPNDGQIAHTYEDGWTMRKLTSPEQCYNEGEDMNHCGAKYAPQVLQGTHKLFSLRDPDNYPHASLVYRPADHSIEDIRGKGNGAPNDKYTEYVKQFFPVLGEGLTFSGHPSPEAPAVPEREKYGLPIVGMEAMKRLQAWHRIAAGGAEWRQKSQWKELSDDDQKFLHALDAMWPARTPHEIAYWLLKQHKAGNIDYDWATNQEWDRYIRYRDEYGARSDYARDALANYHDEFKRFPDGESWNLQGLPHIDEDGDEGSDHPIGKDFFKRMKDWIGYERQKNPDFKLNSYNIDGVKNAWQQWENVAAKDYGKIVHKMPNGWTIRKVQNAREAMREGKDMANCIGSDYAGDIENGYTHIYSLRDEKNKAKVSLELTPQWDRLSPAILKQYGLYSVSRRNDAFWALLQQLGRGRYDSWFTRQVTPNTLAKMQKMVKEVSPPSQLNQVYAKANSEPSDAQKFMLRHWFESMPVEQRPMGMGVAEINHWQDFDKPKVDDYGLPASSLQARWPNIVGSLWQADEQRGLERQYNPDAIKEVVKRAYENQEMGNLGNALRHEVAVIQKARATHQEAGDEAVLQAQQQSPWVQTIRGLQQQLEPHFNPGAQGYGEPRPRTRPNEETEQEYQDAFGYPRLIQFGAVADGQIRKGYRVLNKLHTHRDGHRCHCAFG